jgi:hypothetical protein
MGSQRLAVVVVASLQASINNGDENTQKCGGVVAQAGKNALHRIFPVLFAAIAAAATANPPLPQREESLAAAERQFAADGLRDGVQKSFLAHFAADAVILRPFAVAAAEWYRGHADAPGKLIWGPQYLALSAAGDLGVSSGPWRSEAERDGKPVIAHGHFLSIWRSAASGRIGGGASERSKGVDMRVWQFGSGAAGWQLLVDLSAAVE